MRTTLRSAAAISSGALALFALMAAWPRLARAEDPPPATDEPSPAKKAAPESEAGPAEPKVRVTVFVLPHPDVPEGDMAQVTRELETGLKKNERLEYKDLDSRLADFAQETPSEQIEAARGALRDGQAALGAQRIADAISRLEEAVAGLGKVLPFIKKQELADAMASLAVAQYEGGDKRAGHDQLLELLTWRSDFLYDSDKLPPKYLPMFETAQREIERTRHGDLAIRSTPDGAQAYVDGKYVGVTPCVAEKLVVGKHFVALRKEGYRKAVTAATVLGRQRGQAELELARSETYLLVAQSREKVEKTLGEDLIDAESDSLKQVLFIDQAVFVRASPAGERIAVEGWLYDLRTRQRLSHVKQHVAPASIEGGLAGLAPELYKGVSYEGEIVAPADVPPPKQQVHKPIYKQWWLWTVVGGVVLVGAVVVPVAVIETMPPGCIGDRTCFFVQQ